MDSTVVKYCRAAITRVVILNRKFHLRVKSILYRILNTDYHRKVLLNSILLICHTLGCLTQTSTILLDLKA